MKIILAGISPADALIIKNLFKHHSAGRKIEWLGVATPNADALIFLERFLLTPTIESLVQQLPKSVVIASVRRGKKDSVMPAENGNLHILDLETMKPEERAMWVTMIINSEPNGAAFKKALTAIASQTSSKQTEKVVLHREQPIDSRQKGKECFPGAEIIDKVKRGEELFLTANDAAMYLSPKEGYACVNHAFDAVPPLDNCILQSKQELTMNLPRVLNLKQWLWESLWNSSVDCTPFIDPVVAYQLKRWPQPRGMLNRTLPLRLAGAIQRKAASAKQLVERFNYTEAQIAKFLYTMELVGFVEKKDQTETSTHKQHNESRRSIFARIRERFNFGK